MQGRVFNGLTTQAMPWPSGSNKGMLRTLTLVLSHLIMLGQQQQQQWQHFGG